MKSVDENDNFSHCGPATYSVHSTWYVDAKIDKVRMEIDGDVKLTVNCIPYMFPE